MLPKYFLFVDKYEKNILKDDISNLGIIYRNYSINQNEKDIDKLRSYCSKKKFKFYISNNLRLAIKFKSDGIYIPSFNKRINLNNRSLNKNFQIVGSAHNQVEIKKKLEQGCRAIFLSPLFKIEKNKKYLGICGFNLLTLKYRIKFIALGGIGAQNINNLGMLKISGMAGISYLKKNRPNKYRPVFVN